MTTVFHEQRCSMNAIKSYVANWKYPDIEIQSIFVFQSFIMVNHDVYLLRPTLFTVCPFLSSTDQSQKHISSKENCIECCYVTFHVTMLSKECHIHITVMSVYQTHVTKINILFDKIWIYERVDRPDMMYTKRDVWEVWITRRF